MHTPTPEIPDFSAPTQPYTPAPRKRTKKAAFLAVFLLLAVIISAFALTISCVVQQEKILSGVENALYHQAELEEQGYTLLDRLKYELKVIEEYEDVFTPDKRLKDLVLQYTDALRTQIQIQDNGEYSARVKEWYDANGVRCDVVEALYDRYEFLADDPEFAGDYLQRGNTFRAKGMILGALHRQIVGVDASTDGSGYRFHPFSNETPYTFTLQLDVSFRDKEGQSVFSYLTDPMVIDAGQNLRLYHTWPEEGLEWKSWNINFKISDICLDGNPLKP